MGVLIDHVAVFDPEVQFLRHREWREDLSEAQTCDKTSVGWRTIISDVQQNPAKRDKIAKRIFPDLKTLAVRR
jgi:hypothetical protein